VQALHLVAWWHDDFDVLGGALDLYRLRIPKLAPQRNSVHAYGWEEVVSESEARGEAMGCCKVTDSGIGITPRAINERIFDRFLFAVIQGRSPFVRAAPALDSSIVGAIVRRHHGQILCGASSVWFRESVFSVKLPSLAEAQESELLT